MKIKFLLLIVLIHFDLSAQTGGIDGYDKEISLYRAKEFLMNKVLGVDSKVIKFEMDPLAPTSSGELTTLVYRCEEKNLSGLILGFYERRWNNEGVLFTGYSFKNLDRLQASLFLETIDNYLNEYSEYFRSDLDTNNIYFKFDDMTILIEGYVTRYKIRIFWNEFDAEWTFNAFNRTKKKFEKNFRN